MNNQTSEFSYDHHFEMDEIIDREHGADLRIKNPPKLIINGVSKKIRSSVYKKVDRKGKV